MSIDYNHTINYNTLIINNNTIQYDVENRVNHCGYDGSASTNCKLYSCEELKKIGEELPGVIKYSLKYENGIFEKPTIISETKFKDTEMYNYLINSCN